MNSDLKYDKRNIDLRRSKVLELSAQGLQQNRIAQILGVSDATISLDMQYLTCIAQQNLKTHVQEIVPLQFKKTMSGMTQVLQKAWEIVNNQSSKTSEILQSLALINDTYLKLMNLTTDGKMLEQSMAWLEKQQERSDMEVEDVLVTQDQENE